MNTIVTVILLLCMVTLSLYLLQILRYSGPVEIIGEGHKPVAFLKGKSLNYIANFKYGFSPKINTMAAFTQNKRRLELRRQEFKGADGGSFFIDWYSQEDPSIPKDTPIVMFVHGISGGSYEPYLQKCALRLVKQFNWRCCCYLYRGCCRTPITTTRTYNGGYTEDIHIAIKELSKQYPGAPIALVGYSLGGNMVAKYLGEVNSKSVPICKYKQVIEKDPIPEALKCAVTVGNPCDLYKSNMAISHKNNLFFGKGLLRYAEKHKEQLEKTPKYHELMDYIKKNPKDTRLFLFDDHITCPIFGYKDHVEFYKDASSTQYLDGVRIPLLYIQNRNDPASTYYTFSDALPAIKANENIAAVVIPGGGHLGAFYPTTTRRALDEDLVVRYLRSMLTPQKKD